MIDISKYHSKEYAEYFDTENGYYCSSNIRIQNISFGCQRNDKMYFDSYMDPKTYDYFKEYKQEKSLYSIILDFLNEKQMDEVEVYKKAFIDKRLFSKIRSINYQTSKETLFRLAFALELTLPESKALLQSCGFCYDERKDRELFIMYCFEHGIYDIYEVNNILYEAGMKVLFPRIGGK